MEILQTKLVNISVVDNILDTPLICKDHIICFKPYCLRLLGRRTNSPCIRLWDLFTFIPVGLVLSCIMRDASIGISSITEASLPWWALNGWKRLQTWPKSFLHHDCNDTVRDGGAREMAVSITVIKTFWLIFVACFRNVAFQTLLLSN